MLIVLFIVFSVSFKIDVELYKVQENLKNAFWKKNSDNFEYVDVELEPFFKSSLIELVSY